MNRDQKAAVIEEVAAEITASEAVFAVDYRGISVPQAADLRGRLTEANATMRVVKNTLTERAADKAGAEALKALLEGPTALLFVKGDVAVAAKTISTFRREHEVPQFKGGQLGSEALSIEQLEALAKLPTREVLNQQFVGVLASPLTGLVRGLGGFIGGLAIQLGKIAEQGLVTGGPGKAPEAPAPEEAAAAEDTPPADEAAAEDTPPADDSVPAAGAAAEDAPSSDDSAPDAAAEAEVPAAEVPAEEKTEEPSEAPGDPVAEAEKAEEDTPSEGDTEQEG